MIDLAMLGGVIVGVLALGGLVIELLTSPKPPPPGTSHTIRCTNCGTPWSEPLRFEYFRFTPERPPPFTPFINPIELLLAGDKMISCPKCPRREIA